MEKRERDRVERERLLEEQKLKEEEEAARKKAKFEKGSEIELSAKDS